MKSLKSKIVVVALIACILAVSVASTTIAYFTDHDLKTNTFTYGGGVSIALTEKSADGSYVISAPGQIIDQSPTVTNDSSDSVYVGAIITLKSTDHYLSHVVSLDGANDTVKMLDFFAGGAFEDQSGFSLKATAPTLDTFKVYVVYNKTLAKDESVKLFDGIRIPNGWDHDEMKYMEDLKVTIDTYATQSVGFSSAEEAMKGAFGGGADSTNDHFAGYFN